MSNYTHENRDVKRNFQIKELPCFRAWGPQRAAAPQNKSRISRAQCDLSAIWNLCRARGVTKRCQRLGAPVRGPALECAPLPLRLLCCFPNRRRRSGGRSRKRPDGRLAAPCRPRESEWAPRGAAPLALRRCRDASACRGPSARPRRAPPRLRFPLRTLSAPSPKPRPMRARPPPRPWPGRLKSDRILARYFFN